MRLLLSALLVFASACGGKPDTQSPQPTDMQTANAEPVLFVEVPPDRTRIEPEASQAALPPADRNEQAKRLFQAGVELYEAGDIAAAIEKFREAYLFAPLPALLFNIARGYEQIGSNSDACVAYREVSAHSQADAAMRDAAVQRITALQCP